MANSEHSKHSNKSIFWFKSCDLTNKQHKISITFTDFPKIKTYHFLLPCLHSITLEETEIKENHFRRKLFCINDKDVLLYEKRVQFLNFVIKSCIKKKKLHATMEKVSIGAMSLESWKMIML